MQSCLHKEEVQNCLEIMPFNCLRSRESEAIFELNGPIGLTKDGRLVTGEEEFKQSSNESNARWRSIKKTME